jgi:GT2 family glycosyltransferase
VARVVTGLPDVTIILPVYQAAEEAEGLVETVLSQVPPNGAGSLRAVFMDNGGTADALRSALDRRGNPSHVEVVENPENLGYGGSLNRALEMASTPFVVTCHSDVRFGRDDYVREMVRLLSDHDDVAVVTGLPIIEDPARLTRVEQVYLVAMQMDVDPPDGDDELVTVGFAEGRCDGFRLEAVKAAGMYDRRLGAAGEDQVLSGRFRELGYRVCQAPALPYRLSLSSMQDSLGKLVRLHRRFGRVGPYLVLHNPSTRAGLLGAKAGRNRSRRMMMRLTNIGGTFAYAGLAGALMTRRGRPAAGALVLGVALIKAALLRRHVEVVRPSPAAVVIVVGLQPAFDVAFCVGIVEGWIALRRGDDGGKIW